MNGLDATREVAAIVRGLMHGRPIGPDDDLVAAGLDSVGMIALLGGLEERFGLSIPGEEITPEAFRSIATVAALVARLAR